MGDGAHICSIHAHHAEAFPDVDRVTTTSLVGGGSAAGHLPRPMTARGASWTLRDGPKSAGAVVANPPFAARSPQRAAYALPFQSPGGSSELAHLLDGPGQNRWESSILGC